MDSTYTWHPGSSAVNHRWPLSVSLQRDESLSSFLLRLSHANGADSITVGEVLWPKKRIWTTDTDRTQQAHLNVLSVVSGVDVKLLHLATLNFVESRIRSAVYEKSQGQVVPWLITLGSRNRQRECGFCFCPKCLAEDHIPYFRLNWRFAWHTSCGKHRCLLNDCCPHCSSPITPHLLAIDVKDLGYCSTCLGDLRETIAVSCSSDLIQLQNVINTVVIRGHSNLFDQSVSSIEFFGYLSFFESFLRRAMRRECSSLSAAIKYLHIELPELCDETKGFKFEKLPVSQRHILLQGMTKLLLLSPDDFCSCLIESGVTRQSFMGDTKVLPSVIDSIALKLPDNSYAVRNSAQKLGWHPVPKYLVQRKLKQLIKSFRLYKNRKSR